MIDCKLWVFFFLLLSCGNVEKQSQNNTASSATKKLIPQNNDDKNRNQPKVGYDFRSPDTTYVLDYKLTEISGLAYDPKENHFIANNDEKGKIYYLSNTFKVVEELKFGKSGDYEAIEKIGKNIYIAKSSGKIYEYNVNSKSTKTIKTGLTSKCDIEGLCVDPNDNNLLIACKGWPLSKTENKNKLKAIYKYDLQENQLITEPYLSITDTILEDYVRRSYTTLSKSKLKKYIKKICEFSPSGIAIHPVTKDTYIISAKGSTIVIFNSAKELKQITFLNSKTIPQPEGIAFDNAYNLYIATEGKGLSAKAFRFSYISN